MEAQDVNSALTKQEFMKYVKIFLRFKNPQWNDDTLNEHVEVIAREANERLVLIVGLRDELYGFELRSIQEFFAACHLTNSKDSKQRYKRFEAISRSPYWRNVALFFAGRVGRLHDAEAATILEVCKEVDRQRPDQFIFRGEMLAVQIAADQSFGADGGLQRSVIEYGLTLVNVAPDSKRAKELINTLKEFPYEDIHNHVIPVLKEKILSLRMPYLETVMNLYNIFDPSNKLLLEIIDRFFQSQIEGDFLFAIKKCLEYKIDSVWVRSRLSQLFPKISPELFVKTFGKEFQNDPSYVCNCLPDLFLSENYLKVLLEYIVNHNYSIIPSQLQKEYSINFDTPIDIVTTVTNIIKIANSARYRPMHRPINEVVKGVSINYSYGYQEVKESLLLSLKFRSGIQKLFETSLSTSHDYLIPYLNLFEHLFKFIFQIEEINVESFIIYYKQMKVRYPFIVSFIDKFGSVFHPYIPLIIDSIELNSLEILEDVKYLFAMSTQQKNIESYLIKNFVSIMKSLLTVEQIYLLAFFNSDKLFDLSIREKFEMEIKDQLQINLETLLRLFYLNLDYREDQQIKHLFNKDMSKLIIDISIDEVNQGRNSYITVMLIYQFDILTLDQDIIYKLIDLLKIMMSNQKIENVIRWMIPTLFVNLLAHSQGLIDTNIKEILNMIGKNGMDISILSSNREIEFDQFIFCINKLEIFLLDSENKVALGASLIIDSMLTSFYNRESEFQKRPDFLSGLSLEALLNLHENLEQEIKFINIKLLAFTSFSISQDGKIFLERMRSCKNENEAEAWNYFIHFLRIDNEAESLISFKDFFEEILEQRFSLNYAILEAVLERYNSLITNIYPENPIDEKALGLPLNQGNHYIST